MPLAYFITFTTYGVWLHGRDRGSVDKEHNEPGSSFLPPDPIRESQMQHNMREAFYLLDASRRNVVLETIREVARHRGWRLLACHVRTNHVHLVVTANAKPEKVMSDFKAYASRRLKERLGEVADCKRWTQHGSTRYLWKEEQVAAAVEYSLTGQGEPFAVFDGRSEPLFANASDSDNATNNASTPSEPEASAKKAVTASDGGKP
jgi:REP element-mobilizing transposase RayT